MYIEKYQLITNLDFVSIGAVRTWCHALLVEQSELFGGTRFSVRGFGTDPAWPVFDIFLKCPDYTLADAQSPHIFIGCDGASRPLASGYIMRFKDGPELQLVVADQDAPLAVDAFEGPQDESPILRVWSVLPARVVQFWRRGTNMPSLRWGRV